LVGQLIIGLLKMVGMIVGCCCKLLGVLFTFLSEIILKTSGI